MNEQPKLARKLGFGAAFGAAVGLVVSGTGMFSVGNLAGRVGYSFPIVAIAALVPMMITALCYGELTAMLPGGGMSSEYTTPALGRFWASFSILSGYVLLIMADGGSQLSLGGEALGSYIGVSPILITVLLGAFVLLLNIFDVGLYGYIEMYLTISMMLVYAAMAFMGFFHAGESLTGAVAVNASLPVIPEGGIKTMFGGLGTGVWLYVGFEFCCPMAEENKKPHVNIPRALIYGLLSILLVHSVFAIAAVRYTDVDVLFSDALPHIVASRNMLGNAGYTMMSIMAFLAAFTTANSYMAALPRMMYGLSKDRLVPKIFQYIHPKTKTPVAGIVFTFLLMIVTITVFSILGTDADTLTMMTNVACIGWMSAYLIVMTDLLVLRKKYPDYPRLWVMPAPHILIPIGIVSVILAIISMWQVLPIALGWMAIVTVFIIVWCKVHHLPLFGKIPLQQKAQELMDRSEYLEDWNDAVTAWLEKNPVMKV